MSDKEGKPGDLGNLMQNLEILTETEVSHSTFGECIVFTGAANALPTPSRFWRLGLASH